MAALRFHDLRHTAVALAIAEGAHPLAIRERLGHASISVTLDRDAVRTVPDLTQQLSTGDLQKAGWTITGPRPVANGGEEIQASKPFRKSPANAIAAAPLPRVRRTLVAPVRPLPCAVRSTLR